MNRNDRAAGARSALTRVSDVMHRGVVTCDASRPCAAVARTMAAHRIHSVIVTRTDAVPRVVTDADLLEALHAGTFEGSTADDIAHEPAFVRLSDSLDDVVERMHEQGTTHAVVIGNFLRLIGVVSVLDIAAAVEEKGSLGTVAADESKEVRR